MSAKRSQFPTRSARRSHPRGYALPAVLLFLLFAFSAWAVFFRSSGSSLRVEQARVLRESRETFSAPAMADGLRLLETGSPPSDPYGCKVTLTQDGVTKYFLLNYEKIGPTRWTLSCTATDADDLHPDKPATFAVAPATPTGLAASAASYNTIDLTWSDVPYDTGYSIERSANGTTGWSQIATVAKNVTSYSNSGLTAATQYFYRVRATNAQGNSSYSSTANDTTQAFIINAPSGLAASAGGTTSINLTWTDNSSNETGFQIERSDDGTNGWTQIATASANATSYSNTGLPSSTQFFYRVRAYNGIYTSNYTTTANATTQTPLPTAPSGLAAAASSNTQIDLTWTDNSSNEANFKLERSLDGSSGWTLIATPAANATGYSDTGLSGSTAYYYRLCATNAGGDSSYTSVASDTTLPDPPGAPSALAATGSNSSTIAMTWADNATNESGFKVERSPDGTNGWTQIGTTGANVTSFTDNSGLSPSTTYYYRVRAYNAGGDSAYSTVDPGTTTAIPAIPTGLAPTVMSNTSVMLTWTDNSNNETGFRVQRSTNNVTWNNVTTTAASATTYTVTGLTHNTQYYFRIRANGASGNSANTASVTATP